MIIKNITIENFQSYYDSQTLEFSNGLNLIIGNGGKGKSKLFNAFYWVLFGKIYLTDIGWSSTDGLPSSAKFSMKRQEFICKKTLFDAKVGDKVKTSVRVELEDDKNFLYEIERSVIAERLDHDNWESDNAWSVSNNILKVSHDSINGTQIKTDYLAADKINELFPEGIRNYIWFQGESLDRLINFRNKETLKAAVKHISYFPYYEKLSEIISKSKIKIERLESSKIKDANKHNTNVKGLLTTIDKCRNNIAREEEVKSQLEMNISKIQIALVEDEGKMSGLASFSALISKYKSCESEIERLNNEITLIDEFQREQLPKLWILRGIAPMIKRSEDIIEEHKEEQNTVPEKKYLDNPSRSKLEEILRDKRCFICGSDTSEGTDAHSWVSNRMKEQEEYLREMEEYTNNMEFSKQFERFIGKIQDYPSSLLISLELIDKQWKDSEDKLEKMMAQRRKKLDDKKKLDEQIEDVKRKYNVDPVKQAESAGIVEGTIRASRTNLDREQRKLNQSTELLSQYKTELRTAEKDLEKIGKKEGGISVDETEWKNISTFLEDICKRVQENARKDLLHKIETRANEFYTKFTQHDNGYKGDVKIGEDYSIEFDAGLNTSHEDRKKMSIINALLALNQEAIGTFYPFISDAPTSSFDFETTHKYLLGIKDIFGQSIIMTKDVDVNSDSYQDLSTQSNISRIFMLDSQLYCPENHEPELHEVSTNVKRLR
jgi:DNA sulfur modification protein DndD